MSSTSAVNSALDATTTNASAINYSQILAASVGATTGVGAIAQQLLRPSAQTDDAGIGSPVRRSFGGNYRNDHEREDRLAAD
jgi:hypothetical protein